MACPARHAGVPIALAGAASVYDGDPTQNCLQRPNHYGQDAKGWRTTFRFDGTVAVTVVCRNADDFRHAFMLATAVRSCRQDSRSFKCR